MKAAVIGTGYQGTVHLEAFREVGVDVVAICEIDEGKRKEVARQYGMIGHHYADYREMLETEELDIVSVCSMPVDHRRMTVDALQSGAHVICEKPMAMSATEGAEMIAAARDAGRVLSIGYNLRFTEAAQRLKRHTEEGRLGLPLYTRAWGKASHPPWWGQHYRNELSGGGALASTAVHFLDLALWLAGGPRPITVSGSMTTAFPRKRGGTAPRRSAAELYDVEDLVSAHIRFADGFWMTLKGSWVEDHVSTPDDPFWDYSLQTIGTNGTVDLNPLALREEHEGVIRDVTPSEVRGGLDFSGSTRALIHEFVAAINTGRVPLVRPEEALAVQTICDAIYASARLGRDVAVADVDI